MARWRLGVCYCLSRNQGGGDEAEGRVRQWRVKKPQFGLEYGYELLEKTPPLLDSLGSDCIQNVSGKLLRQLSLTVSLVVSLALIYRHNMI